MADEKYTDEELEGLTEEEREALLAEDDDQDGADDDDAADDPEAAAAGGDDDPNDPDTKAGDDKGGKDDDAGDGGDDDPDDDQGGKADGEGDDDPAGGDGGDDDPKDKGADDKATSQKSEGSNPVFVADLPEDYDDRVKDVKDRKAELLAKYDDGEVTGREFQEQLDSLNEESFELRMIKRDAENAAKMAEQQAKNQWQRDIETFMAEHPQYRPPAEGESNPLLFALDGEVKRLAQARPDLTDREVLYEAHKSIQEKIGGGGDEADPDPDKEKGSQKRKREPMRAPRTLAKTPAADMTGVDENKYSRLDRLMEKDPMAYEEALAKMSDSEREAYLATE